jgi:putative glutamine amidotransferase
MTHQADLVREGPRRSCFVVEQELPRTIAEAGGTPVILPLLDEPPDLSRFDAIVLPGGGDVDPRRYGADPAGSDYVDPQLDAFEIEMVNQAWKLGMPSLGICRGMQVLNVARGGDLVMDLPSLGITGHQVSLSEGAAHSVRVEPSSLLARLLESSPVSEGAAITSGHHQAVKRLGEGLMPVAWSDLPGRNDHRLIEAIEAADVPVLGIQWHPEESGPGHRDLEFFRRFVQLAARGGR